MNPGSQLTETRLGATTGTPARPLEANPAGGSGPADAQAAANVVGAPGDVGQLAADRLAPAVVKPVDGGLGTAHHLRPGQFDARTRAWRWEQLRANAVGQAIYKRRQRTAMGRIVVR